MRKGAAAAFSSSLVLSIKMRHWVCAQGMLFGITFFFINQIVPAAFGQVRPANDNFANAIQLNGTNVTISGSNVNATREPGEPDHAGNSGGKSVWWDWRAPAAGYVKISTLGSVDTSLGGPLDTVLGVYVGNSVSNLMQVASSDDGPVDLTSEVFFRPSAGTLYRIAVDGYSLGTPDSAASGTIRLWVEFSLSAPLAAAWGPLPDIDGSAVSSTNFTGQVVVLNFWATWCGPCVAEISDLIALQNIYASAGLSVVGVSVDDSTDGINPPLGLVSSFAANQGINYHVAMSRPHGYGIESAYGGIPYIPNTFVIDRQNHLIQTFVGSQTYATFESAVLPLLYPPPSISLRVSAGRAQVSWPITQLSLSVETTDQLANGVWTSVAATPQSDGLNQFINVPFGTGSQFFRLRGQ